MTKSKKVNGKYGKYSSRKKGNKFEIRKRVNGTDFSASNIDEKVAIKDLDAQIDYYYTEQEKLQNQPKFTFGEYADKWLKSKEFLVSYGYYEQHVRSYIKPVAGNIPLSDLRFDDLQLILDKMYIGQLSSPSRKKGLSKKELEESKKPLSEKTMQNVKGTICQIIKNAVNNKYIDNIPVEDLKVYETDSEEKPILTLQEEEKFLSFLFEELCSQIMNDEPIDDDMLLLFFMDMRGLRASEACGIQVKDVFLDERIVKLSDGLQRIAEYDENGIKKGYKVKKTKLKSKDSKRNIYLNDLLYIFITKKILDYYNDCKSRGIEPDGEDYLFRTKSGRKETTRHLQKVLDRILENLGLPHIGTHSLRRQFATKGFESGLELEGIRSYMGHSDVKMTSHYVRIRDEKAKQDIKKIDNNVLKIFKKSWKEIYNKVNKF